jgi:hypothetical protein
METFVAFWVQWHMSTRRDLMSGGKLFTKRIVSTWLLFLLVLSTFSIHADYFKLEEEKKVFTIYVGSNGRGDILEDANVIETYDSFVLARLTDFEANRFRNRNIGVVEEPDLSTLAIDGFVFDTRDGPPEVPGYLQVPEPSDGVITSYILQFKGPIKSDWVAELEASGVQIRDYVPFHSFLTRMTPEVKEKVDLLPFVRWIGFYEPMYKVQPDLWSENDDILVEQGRERVIHPFGSRRHGNRLVHRWRIQHH